MKNWTEFLHEAFQGELVTATLKTADENTKKEHIRKEVFRGNQKEFKTWMKKTYPKAIKFTGWMGGKGNRDQFKKFTSSRNKHGLPTIPHLEVYISNPGTSGFLNDWILEPIT